MSNEQILQTAQEHQKVKSLKRKILNAHKFDVFLLEENPHYQYIIDVRNFFNVFRNSVAHATSLPQILSSFKKFELDVHPIFSYMEITDDEFNTQRLSGIHMGMAMVLGPNTEDSIQTLMPYFIEENKTSSENEESEYHHHPLEYELNTYEEIYMDTDRFSPEYLLKESAPVYEHPNFPALSLKISEVIQKFQLSSIQKEASSALTFDGFFQAINQLDCSVIDVFKKMGLKKECFGLDNKISISFTLDEENYASFNPDFWGIELSDGLVMDKIPSRLNKTIFSSILHEWIHAIDYKTITEILFLKYKSPNNEKPNIIEYDHFASEQSRPFYIPFKATEQAQQYFHIRDVIEGFLCHQNAPDYESRTARNKRIIETFYKKNFHEEWLNSKTRTEQNILLSEKAFMAFRNTILTFGKKFKDNNFIQDMQQMGCSFSIAEEKVFNNIFSNKQSRLILKALIKDNESLLNKKGGMYLKIAKNADVHSNEIIVHNISYIHEHEAYPTVVPTGIHNKFNKNIHDYMEPTHDLDDEYSLNYYQNPSEMLSRYFERHIYPVFNITQDISKMFFGSTGRMPLFSDKQFQIKKDVLFASIFGISSLAPRNHEESYLTQEAKNFLSNLEEQKDCTQEHLNPSQALHNNVMQYRECLEIKSFWKRFS